MARRGTFYETLTAAVRDFAMHGFDSQERLERWLGELRRAADATLIPEVVLIRQLHDALGRIYERMVVRGGVLRLNSAISQYTFGQIKPKLHAEFQRRILASANLITLNRDASVQKTLQRFAGWATSIPINGSGAVDRTETKNDVRRGISGLPFEERRVIVDQGHKLAASINDIVCRDGGAIAYIWHHVKERQPAYDARPEHVARDGEIYVIRDNWALRDGLMKLAGHPYYDEITAAAEEPFCRCSVQGLFALRSLPVEMVTDKGRAALVQARAA